MEPKSIHALIVEDNPDQVHVLTTALAGSQNPKFTVESVDSLAGGIARVSQGGVQAILLDLNVKDSRGVGTVLRMHEHAPYIPIVVLTGSYDESHATEALQRGAQDYLLKGMADPHTIIRSVRYAIERKRAEEEVRRVHFENEQLLSAITSILIRVNSEGSVTHWNKVAERTFTISQKDAIGRSFKDCGIDWKTGDVHTAISRALNSKEHVNLDDVGFKYADGRDGLLGVTIIPLEEEGGSTPGFVLFGADVTERKQQEREQRRLEEHVRQVQKLESLGTLAGGIAHDFKNILGPILGYTEMLMRNFPQTSKEYDRLSKIQKATYRAKKLVEQILTFSRKGDENRTNVNVAETAQEAYALLREVLPSTIEIILDVDKAVGTIVANQTQIHQVVMNLCVNGGYAMRETGGKLTIFVRKCDVDEDFAKLHVGLNPGPHVRLSVSDTGQGIDPGIVSRIFDPFFTTKPVGEGSGMGLAVVHGIVSAHGGIIEVSSKIGQGSIFDIYFPQSVEAVETPGPEELQVPHGSEHVLVVDDDVSHLDMLADVLESLGYRVEKRSNSLEALELFRSKPETFDLVILDQLMPKMTGTKLAKELLIIRPKLPIILCTGSYTMTVREAKGLGILKCLEKPVSIGELSQAVREAFAKP